VDYRMPSYRSQFCRMLIKYLVAIKFNPNKTIDEMRRGVESLSKLAGLPSKTNVEKIKLNNISAEWVCSKEAREDRVILYLHGGGYNICSPNTHRELSAYISMASSAKVLLIDYHLAPEHPFPTALEDATLTYRWLLKNGFSGGDIALAGDSAGGGLAIATSISLRDGGNPPPTSIACISPWTDLEMSGNSIKTHAQIDPMLNLQSIKLMASNYIGENDPRNPLISPIYANLKGIPPMLIHVGSDEMLLDDSTRIAEKAKSAGVDVTLKIYDKMWHVWHLNAKLMPEAKNAIKELGSFIRSHFVN
jgi:monoterpene epsilon-lactone hydrolase